MIVAFGEAIVAIGSAVADETPSWELAALLAVGILGAITLWWAYFDRMEELWEWALGRAGPSEVGSLARDVYSILHYPMLAGVVLYAVAVEEVLAHPNQHMEPMVQVALALSLVLFLVPIVFATWRAVRGRQFERGIAAVVIAGVVLALGDMAAKNVLLITTVLLVLSMVLEYLRFRTRIRERLISDEARQTAD
jgi:low temperature requirement protein LtrA